MSYPYQYHQDYRQQTHSSNMIPMIQPQYISSPQNKYQFYQPQQPAQQQQHQFHHHHMMAPPPPPTTQQYHHMQQQHAAAAAAAAQYGGYPIDDEQQQQHHMGHMNHHHSQQIGSGPSRTVYLGNIPENLSPKQLLDHVRSGTVENVRIFPSKNCAFISFLDDHSAMLFHSDAILKRLSIGDNDIRIGWGKPSPVAPVVMEAVNRYNATRNVYVGNLSADFFEDEDMQKELLETLEEYGTVESYKFLKEKRIAFLHFTSILSAIRTVQNLPLAESFKDKKVSYGKDRCAFITKTQQHNAAQYLGLNPNFDNNQILSQVDREFISNALVQQSNAAAAIATSAGGANNLGNRTVYLGNLHPDTTLEEICNVVRGGILQNIRLIKERHVCFITFIDPIAAAQFFAMSSLNGLIIHGRKIKIGWGKHSGGLSNALSLAVGNGASRNIYIGGLDMGVIDESSDAVEDSDNKIVFSKKRLFEDFKPFGEIEQINFFAEKNCAFVNFTNISNAIKAMDGIKEHPVYSKLKINFGKDRCGNLPRQFNKSADMGFKDDDFFQSESNSSGSNSNVMAMMMNGLKNGIENIDEDEDENEN